VGKMMTGTGFFGFIQLSDKSLVVLVTNYHIIGDEKVAGNSSLKFEYIEGQLKLKEFMVETSFICSDMEKVLVAIVVFCTLIDWPICKVHHGDAKPNMQYKAFNKHVYLIVFQGSSNP